MSISAAVPWISPPCAEVITLVTPLARVMPMCSECGFTAVSTSSCGLNCPSSWVSCPPGTEPISTRPSRVPESIRPGYPLS